MLNTIARSVLRTARLERPQRIPIAELGSLIFGQLHPQHQDFFDKHCRQFDTVFCCSLYAHVSDKSVLEQNIVKVTSRTLYFEGHENSSQGDYEHIFRHFRKVEHIGFNRDGMHSRKSTRPFFRCQR